jgi:hypothetical protein
MGVPHVSEPPTCTCMGGSDNQDQAAPLSRCQLNGSEPIPRQSCDEGLVSPLLFLLLGRLSFLLLGRLSFLLLGRLSFLLLGRLSFLLLGRLSFLLLGRLSFLLL